MIVIYDSGIGGFEITKKLQDKETKSSHKPIKLLYYADSSNFPYGNKTKEELETIIKENLEKFIAAGAKHIVIACNTASAIAQNLLNEGKYKEAQITHTITALKQIITQTPSSTLICTVSTKEALNKQSEFQKVKIIEMSNLANAIENNNIQEIINEIKSLPKKTKHITYGCTHFSLAQKYFSKQLNIEYQNPIDYMLTEIIKKINTSYQLEIKFNNLQIEQKYHKYRQK